MTDPNPHRLPARWLVWCDDTPVCPEWPLTFDEVLASFRAAVEDGEDKVEIRQVPESEAT